MAPILTHRPTPALRTHSVGGRLFLVQKVLHASSGRPRTNTPFRFRLFEILPSEDSPLIVWKWLTSLPTLREVKAFIHKHTTTPAEIPSPPHPLNTSLETTSLKELEALYKAVQLEVLRRRTLSRTHTFQEKRSHGN